MAKAWTGESDDEQGERKEDREETKAADGRAGTEGAFEGVSNAREAQGGRVVAAAFP
jgi:hypothetical protein